MQAKFHNFIKKEFEFRCLRNPHYSMRAFSRDLGLTAPKMSQLLKGRGGISPVRAHAVAQKLRLSEVEIKIFVALVAADHSRSPLARQLAREQLNAIAHSSDYATHATFHIISDWYYFAILELTETLGFKSNAGFIATRLGLPVTTAEQAVERLLEMGLLKEMDGRWVQSQQHLSTSSEIPSRHIRNYHHQILAKADLAIEQIPVAERDLSAMTIGISESQLKEAQAEIKKFRRELSQRLEKNANPKDRVYCLSMQFFPLDLKETL